VARTGITKGTAATPLLLALALATADTVASVSPRQPPASSFLRIERGGITSGASGCRQTVHLVNRHPDRPIGATILKSQHLFSGDIQQRFIVHLLPGSTFQLGCSRWSGAARHTDFEILDAWFDEPIAPLPPEIIHPPELNTTVSVCKEDDGGEPPGDSDRLHDEDEFEISLDRDFLVVIHRNAIYNCCLDDILISMNAFIAGSRIVIALEERESLTIACGCVCPCEVIGKAQGSFPPGEYVIEICWQDSGSEEKRCHSEVRVIR
jgi:hypothetical protein